MKIRYCVVLPDGDSFSIQLDQKAKGQSCLDQVCKRVGIIEYFYFGLQYRGANGEWLWLNVRNSITGQVRQGSRLHFRVKFPVEPQHLVTEESRVYCYKSALHHVLSNVDKYVCDLSRATRVGGLFAQAEWGDYDEGSQQELAKTRVESMGPSLHQSCCKCGGKAEHEGEYVHSLVEGVLKEYRALRGMKVSTARYKALQELWSLEAYCSEYHTAWRGPAEVQVIVGVDPQGVSLRKSSSGFTAQGKAKRIEFSAIRKVEQTNRNFEIEFFSNDYATERSSLTLNLASAKAAEALYRAVTERHCFYRCNTVREDVNNQFCRTVSGALVAFFNENTDIGKEFLFDVSKTRIECYDYARRAIFRQTGDRGSTFAASSPVDSVESEAGDVECVEEDTDEDDLCLVCKDSRVAVTFVECSHRVCCPECAVRLDPQQCPVCRVELKAPSLPLSTSVTTGAPHASFAQAQ